MALEVPEHTTELQKNFVNTILRLGLDNRTIDTRISESHDDVLHPHRR
jgi:hypothetical protein